MLLIETDWLKLACVSCVCVHHLLTLHQGCYLLEGFLATQEGGGSWSPAAQRESPRCLFWRSKSPVGVPPPSPVWDKLLPADEQPRSPAPPGLHGGVQSKRWVVLKARLISDRLTCSRYITVVHIQYNGHLTIVNFQDCWTGDRAKGVEGHTFKQARVFWKGLCYHQCTQLLCRG